MKKIKFIYIYIICICSNIITAQNLNNEAAIQLISQYNSSIHYGDIMDKLKNDTSFNLPLLAAIPTILLETKDRKIQGNCISLLQSIVTKSPNIKTKQQAVNCTLDFLIKANQIDPYFYSSNILGPLAAKPKAYFDEIAIEKILILFKLKEKDHYLDVECLLDLARIIKDKRFIPLIKQQFMNECKNEYTELPSNCYYSKLALACMGDKKYQNEVVLNLKQKSNLDLVENHDYAYDLKLIGTPAAIDLLLRVMNDKTCQVVRVGLDIEVPCANNVIGKLGSFAPNLPKEIRQMISDPFADEKNIEVARKWFTKHQKELKSNAVKN